MKLAIGLLITILLTAVIVLGIRINDINGTSSGNFNTSVLIFRENYANKKHVFFADVEERTTVSVDDLSIAILPAKDSHKEEPHSSFNPGVSNVGGHLNGLLVMLTCHYLVNKDSKGPALLSILQQYAPEFRLSTPELGIVSLKALRPDHPMVQASASQWRWRMNPAEFRQTMQAR